MSGAPDPTMWLKELARAGLEETDHRPDEQFAAITAALDRRRARRLVAAAASVAALAATAAIVAWTPRGAPSAPAAELYFSTAAWTDQSPQPRVTQASVPTRSLRPAHEGSMSAVVNEPAAAVAPGAEAAMSRSSDDALVESSDKPGKNARADDGRRTEPPAMVRPPKPPPAPQRRAHQDGGDASVALAAMDDAKFERFIAAASADELLQIAHDARAERAVPRARTALLAIRERFAEHDAAHQATFLLGRVEAELAKKPRRAASWFARYVREYPQGPLVGQARGRLVAHYAKAGRTAEARAAARDYLDHHARGPYAELASALLE